jgi:hypothetical protein
MQSPCDPPKFVEEDWSKFDFSRWHLDGVKLGPAAAVVAEIAERLFNSEEWRQNFQITLPEFQQRALDLFKDHSKDLREQRTAVVEDFRNRTAAAQQRSEAFRKSVEASSSPAVVEPTANAFHVSVRVVSEKDPSLGLPNIGVKIVDPRNEKEALSESFTDHDGNTVLTVPPDVAEELDKKDLELQVIDPTGKPLAKVPNGVCIRVGQTETRVVKVAESPTIAENKNLALETRSLRETNARRLAGRSEVLQVELKRVVEILDCRLKNNDAIVADLEKPAPRTAEPSKETTEPSKESTESEAESGTQKRRKKP